MSEDLKEAVRKGYAAVANSGLSSNESGVQSIAASFGYSPEELASIPAESNMGLSCGNPVAMASLHPGETVVDLGSGGGLDVFLASQKVGPEGMAIGIDMTGDMVSLARRNAHKGGYTNVKFYLGEIEAMPLPDNSVDCVISNCVLNLCPDKDLALREIYRVLKPGGRLAISDIALKQSLPESILKEVAAWTGCIAGALTIEENRSKLSVAGFGEVAIQDANSDLNAYRDGGHAACCGPDSGADMSAPVAPLEVPREGALSDPSSTESACCPQPEDDSACCEPAAVNEEACCAPTEDASPCCEPTPAAKSAVDSASPEAGPGTVTDSGAESYHETMSDLLDRFDVNAYAASVKIFAIKPRS